MTFAHILEDEWAKWSPRLVDVTQPAPTYLAAFTAGWEARGGDPTLRVHVDTQPDTETTARLFNDGYDAAMTQHLADDPTAADDWLAEHDAELLRPLKERLAQIDYLMSFEYSASVLGEQEAARSIGLVRYLQCPPRVRRLLQHVMARSERIRSVLEGS